MNTVPWHKKWETKKPGRFSKADKIKVVVRLRGEDKQRNQKEGEVQGENKRGGGTALDSLSSVPPVRKQFASRKNSRAQVKKDGGAGACQQLGITTHSGCVPKASQKYTS
eukprot:TRINITY_DN14873_c0_g1_i1.p2 TRINITY_DN14873_c0_g1~~TRINITY_DN14873_c0_g1_i1.p2  ORF type:complete len:110 (+),score=8.01 TRINITY_DN14873_c0_g1_i1:614-943(+)